MSELYNDLPLTSFPSTVDSFTTWLNITASDGPLIAQYQAALEAGNTVLANQILAQIPSATQKIIKATDLNQLTQAILAVERFYKTDIEPYIQNQQESWLNTINQFSYKGAWSSGTAYLQNNIVLYTTSGLQLLFLATATPPLGTPPTNTSYWRVLTIQGQQGTSGPGLTYMQEWNSSTTYNTNDAVTYSGGLWMALQANTNVQPGTNEEFWKLVIPIISTTYPIQSTQPLTQSQGDLWFNTQDNPTQYYYLEQLENPADTSKLWLNYEAYDDQGNLITGEFETYTKEEIDTEKAAIIESYPVNIGENVTAGQVVDVVTVTDLSVAPIGTVVNLLYNNELVPHILVQRGNPNLDLYDSSCDGVWLLRKDIIELGQWNATAVNTLPGSTIMTNMQNYVNNYDTTVQANIKTVKIPYCVGNGSDVVNILANGVECKIFPLGNCEVGITTLPNSPIDGSKLDYFDSGSNQEANSKRLAEFNKLITGWHLRSVNTVNNVISFLVNTSGTVGSTRSDNQWGYRPCFVLPTNTTVLSDGTITTSVLTSYITTSGTPSTAIALESGNAGDTIPVIFTGTTSAPFIARDQIIQGANGGVFGYGILDGILGVTAKQVGAGIESVKIATGSYVGTGTYGANNPNTLTFPFEPKAIIILPDIGPNPSIPSLVLNCSAKTYGMVYIIGNNITGGGGELELDGNTLKWWATYVGSSATYDYIQFNFERNKYHYVAIG